MKVSYNPYIKDEGKKVFTQSFCVYFDILGFKEKIKSIKKDGLSYFEEYLETLNEILNHLSENNEFSDENKNKRFELKIFTDNFVIGYPWNDEFGEQELGEIFDVIAYVQLKFIKKNIFLKGAISYSNLFMDKNIVIGEALIEAYQLEEGYSIYPRVILSDSVSKIVQQHINFYHPKIHSPQNQEYLIDSDGHYFINYLYYLKEHYVNDDGIELFEKINSELLIHKKKIIEELTTNRENNRVYEKFLWLANYHNYFCNTFLNKKFYKVTSLTIQNKYFKSISRCAN